MEIPFKKISIIGGESVFKTTLSEKLSQYFKCPWVEEYAREYFKDRDFEKLPFCDNDFINVANGQLELERKSIKLNSNSTTTTTTTKLLICDTCPLITLIWSDTLIGSYSNELYNIVKKSEYDFYIFLDYKTKWVKDELRLIPEEKEREIFQSKLIDKCKELSITYFMLDGTYENREKEAIKLIESHFSNLLK